MIKHIKSFIGALTYIFSNYFICNIPCWHIRKLLYQLLGMKIGKNTRINMKVLVWDPWKISIGDDTIINEYAFLDGRGGLLIGDNTSIAMWVVIYSSSHYSDSPTFEYYTKPTSIGNCCWVCARSIILPGSSIADRVIIGANTVFKGDAHEQEIYSGNPCKLVKNRKVKENYHREWKTHLR